MDKTASMGAVSSLLGMKIIVSLGLVILLFIILALVVKKTKFKNLSGFEDFKVLATLPIGLKEKIMLVQSFNRFLLIGATSHNLQLLHDFGDQCPIDLNQTDGKMFKKTLNKILRKPPHV